MIVLPDYTNADNWLVIPDAPKAPVDVFYIVPTAYHPADPDTAPDLCGMDDAAVRKRAGEHIAHKGSCFITVGNFYAPMYRQTKVKTLISDDPEAKKTVLSGSFACVAAAFETYMRRHNHGKPFILAAHSQGSMMLAMLLSSVFAKHKSYLDKMIAAYVIGFGITRDYLTANPHLTFAEGRDDTGVIISYNTEAPGVTARNITLPKDSVCINPISWTRDSVTAPKEDSLGAHLMTRDAEGNVSQVRDIPHYADATVDQKRGVVVCSTVDPSLFAIPEEPGFFPPGVMHSGDLPLYYYDLRQNAIDRINAYFASRGNK